MTPHPFDLSHTELIAGTTLLEASAGTGKTYAIAGLYLRLLLEKNLGVENILVVTFTEAATSELRDRIRDRLVAARRALLGGDCTDDLLEHLQRLATEQAGVKSAWLAQLQAALETLDEAAVFTIHGFCSRVLKERAFDSGLLFDAALSPDISQLRNEAVDNFWRRRFYHSSSIRLAMVLHRGLDTDRFKQLFVQVQQHPDLIFVSSANPESDEPMPVGLAACEQALQSHCEHVATLWRQDETEIRSYFGDSAAWAKMPYNRSEDMEVVLDQVSQLLARVDAAGVEKQNTVDSSSIDINFQTALPEQVKALEMFTPEALKSKRKTPSKKNPAEVPDHPFFDACARCFYALDNYVEQLQREFIQDVSKELRAIKEREKCLGFDDLLNSLRDALRGPGADALIMALRNKYPAVLIDEFQDTDPVQYEIFKRLFQNGKTHLYLVGDPKQAIYSFRGADVFAYLKAREHVAEERRFSLDKNWRSESGLVASVNGMFEHPHPFLLDAIPFHPVEPRGQVERTPLTRSGERVGGLSVCLWDPDDAPSQTSARWRQLANGVASEIVRWLDGTYQIGARSLQAGDMAVLVESHLQAAEIQKALARRGVPAVQQTQESVFHTDEARELLQLLSALVNPGHSGWIRGALATRILGWSASDLDALREDEVLWETWWTRLDGYRADWEQRGFFSMWRRLTRREMVQARLLNLVDGERRLTNLVHLAELLHAEAVHRQLGPQALVDWLAERRVADPGTVDLDETLLRLESDDAAVRLVTIHRSKGLEYGIVFCPFLNRTEALRRGALLLYHDPAANGQLTCDLSVSPSTQVQSIAEGERMAENLRLAYVALTRARHRCALVWGGGGGSGKPDTSALSWLLDPPQDLEQRPNSEWIEHLRVHSKARTEEDRTSALLNWQTRVQKDSTRLGLGNDVPHLSLDPMPVVSPASWTPADTRTQDVTGSVRRFKGRIDREWTVASFTSLSRGLEYAGPVSDKGQDEIVPASVDPVPVKVRDPFSGVRAGLCLHDIFEQLDFTAAPDMRRAVVVDRLKAHGLFTRNVEERVDRWVELALTLTLPMPPGFQLCQVATSNRLVELEFHLPLQNLTSVRLQSAFQKSRWTDSDANTEPLSEWNFEPCHGLLRGFIDVLIRYQGRYYLIDWKSNDLGPVETAYTPETLSRTMVRSQYVLQYHLYTAAADLYLRSRIQNYDYERDFGGALYVFVRGLSPDRPDHGIYWDRPDPTLIASLQSVLIAANPIQAAHAAS